MIGTQTYLHAGSLKITQLFMFGENLCLLSEILKKKSEILNVILFPKFRTPHVAIFSCEGTLCEKKNLEHRLSIKIR